MAPEIVYTTKIYSKSVDIWAIGIIMHMVLTGGNHPLGDPAKSKKDQDWKEILKNQKTNVDGDSSISKVARSLFQNMCKLHPTHRYTAKEALKHPWITRKL